MPGDVPLEDFDERRRALRRRRLLGKQRRALNGDGMGGRARRMNPTSLGPKFESFPSSGSAITPLPGAGSNEEPTRANSRARSTQLLDPSSPIPTMTVGPGISPESTPGRLPGGRGLLFRRWGVAPRPEDELLSCYGKYSVGQRTAISRRKEASSATLRGGPRRRRSRGCAWRTASSRWLPPPPLRSG